MRETFKAAAFALALALPACTIDGEVDHNVTIKIEGVCGDVIGAVKNALKDSCDEECEEETN
jgi:hypothetical protein